ncbi:M57 family metalloprotease [Mariniflexile gromovii]|uniref:Dual-action HEIGH metallo-peptidase n=1 Tax=Mariniflexile gromovii TaxID=362523 RepID=A0ABS4BVM9_9FLAO|nr:M57 family metalloprotease [Mariniflexile gromovii]MBP0904641.1 hypothetical protein [Mariniflexile gromovii]
METYFRTYSKIVILLTGILLTFTNCEKDNPNIGDELLDDFNEYEITENDVLKMKKLDFNPSGLRLVGLKNNEQTTEKYYIVEGDIMINYAQVDKMIDSKKSDKYSPNSKTNHYSSNNVVDNNKIINIRGVNQGVGVLPYDARIALIDAVQNYNDLNIGLEFILTFGPQDNSKDINAIEIFETQPGGRADFPFSGNPGSLVRMFSGSIGYSSQVLKHIWTHEIGHSLGLRHTDWFSRESCGYNVSEPVNPVDFPNANGANHIPGTPTGFDPNSIMLSCFDSSTATGEFDNYDKIALNYLFPAPPLPTVNISGTTYMGSYNSVSWTYNGNVPNVQQYKWWYKKVNSAGSPVVIGSTGVFVAVPDTFYSSGVNSYFDIYLEVIDINGNSYNSATYTILKKGKFKLVSDL